MTGPRASSPRHARTVRDWFRKLITFWTLIALVSAIALFTFADIGEDVAEQSTTKFDNAVSAWFVAHQNPLLYKIALVFTWIGSPTVMVVLAIGAAAWFYTRRGRSKAGVVVVTLCYVLARERIISWPAAIMIGGAVPLVVGLTRLYLNVHWATDVVAGWTVGLFVAAMSAALYEHLRSSAPPAVDDVDPGGST